MHCSPLQISAGFPIVEAQNMRYSWNVVTQVSQQQVFASQSQLRELGVSLTTTKWFGRDINPQVHYTAPRRIR